MNKKDDLDVTDGEFVKDLQESDLYRAVVGLWLLNEGFNVTLFATRVRPNSQERFAYADEGDLEIWNDKYPGHTRIEVKHNHQMFTSAEDYPFRSVIVETAQKMDNLKRWGRKEERPCKVIRLNRDLSYCLIINGSTKPHWTKETFDNSKTGRAKPCYFVNKHIPQYKKLPGYVRTWAKILQGNSISVPELEGLFVTEKTKSLFFCEGRCDDGGN